MGGILMGYIFYNGNALPINLMGGIKNG